MENQINKLEPSIEEEDSSFFNFNSIKFFFHLLSWWPLLIIGLGIGFSAAFLMNRYKTDIFKAELIIDVETEQKN